MTTTGAASNYLENKLVNHVLRGTPYTPPSSCFVALLTAVAGDATAVTELSGGAYVRRVIGFSSATSGWSASSADVTFPTATSDWGNISYYGIYDAITGGNLLFWGQWDTTRAVGSGSIAKIVANNLVITMD